MTLPPTAVEIRADSQVKFARLGLSSDDDLQRVVDRSVAYIQYVTGQNLDALVPPDGTSMTQEQLEPLVAQAIQMRTEQVAMQGRQGHVDAAASNEVISGFTAGSYSEQHRDPNRKKDSLSINTWPALDELLWMILTPDRFSWWWAFLTGNALPEFMVEEIAWGGVGGSISFFEPWDRYVIGAGY